MMQHLVEFGALMLLAWLLLPGKGFALRWFACSGTAVEIKLNMAAFCIDVLSLYI